MAGRFTTLALEFTSATRTRKSRTSVTQFVKQVETTSEEFLFKKLTEGNLRSYPKKIKLRVNGVSGKFSFCPVNESTGDEQIF